MIGLDTNILVRYFAQDDSIQARTATEIMERRLTEANPGFISIVTMVETVWVLGRTYRLSDGEIAETIERTLGADVFIVEDEQEVFVALTALKEGQASFADALIAALGAKAGCARTLTFDRAAARFPGFALVA